MKRNTMAAESDKKDWLEVELENIVGLEPVKDQLRQLRRRLELNKKKREIGAPVSEAAPLHMVFKGNPGRRRAASSPRTLPPRS
jgi:hypothetical protein